MSNSQISRREMLKGAIAAGGTAALGSSIGVLARDAHLDDLAGRLQGPLITPEHDQYEQARQVWNAMIDRRPAAIARCSGVADVVDVVRFARDTGMDISVRGGGHNVAGKAVRDDAIMIDLGLMNGVWVDPGNKRARVQGGARWGAFDNETLVHNLATTGGTVGTTGVGGLTLGGGVGWLARKHGLSCDNVVSADMVLADGSAVTASADQNPDLYWAIRGGGGNFGIVTSFEFEVHELEPMVGGLAVYPGHTLKDLVHFYRDYTADAPDGLMAMVGAFYGPPGTSVEGEVAAFSAVSFCGPTDEGVRLLQPFKDFGPPALDIIGPTDYGTQQTLFAAGGAMGTRNYWRSSFLRELSDDAIDVMVRRSAEMPKPGSMFLIEHLGGAIGRVGQNETAFANRGANYNMSIFGTWLDPSEDEKNNAWVRATGDEVRSFSTGGAYVNYMAADEPAENVRAAYEANFARLREVKRQYDPTNFFNSNQNIAP